jgi:hypothetical protein
MSVSRTNASPGQTQQAWPKPEEYATGFKTTPIFPLHGDGHAPGALPVHFFTAPMTLAS